MGQAIIFVVGIGITAGILFLVQYSLDQEKHGLLKLLLMMGILALTLLMPKTFGDAQQVCETVVSNSTVVNSSVTSYEYTAFCFTDGSSTPSTFMQTIFWIYRGIIAYVIVYLFVISLGMLYEMRRQRPGGRN